MRNVRFYSTFIYNFSVSFRFFMLRCSSSSFFLSLLNDTGHSIIYHHMFSISNGSILYLYVINIFNCFDSIKSSTEKILYTHEIVDKKKHNKYYDASLFYRPLDFEYKKKTKICSNVCNENIVCLCLVIVISMPKLSKKKRYRWKIISSRRLPTDKTKTMCRYQYAHTRPKN
jgi:hypothetical protein